MLKAIIAVLAWWSAGSLQPGQGQLLPFFNQPQISCGIASNDGQISYQGLVPGSDPNFCISQLRYICFAQAGYYHWNFKVAMQPGAAAEGNFYIEPWYQTPADPDPYGWQPFPARIELLYWKVTSGPNPTFNEGSTLMYSKAGQCWVLTYSASGPAQIIPDRLFSRLMIHGVGS